MADPIKLWLVEDDSDYLDSFSEVIASTHDIQREEAFSSLAQVRDAVVGITQAERPDVVLLDIGLPGESGLSGVRWLKEEMPGVPIVMLTVQDAAEVIFQAFRSGASGYILKDTPVARIKAAIREAAAGGTLMPAPVADKVLGLLGGRPDADFGLSSRESQVLNLMADGLHHGQIAARLFISPHTVDNHLRSIYRKLHVQSGIQAVVKAMRSGLI